MNDFWISQYDYLPIWSVIVEALLFKKILSAIEKIVLLENNKTKLGKFGWVTSKQILYN